MGNIRKPRSHAGCHDSMGAGAVCGSPDTFAAPSPLRYFILAKEPRHLCWQSYLAIAILHPVAHILPVPVDNGHPSTQRSVPGFCPTLLLDGLFCLGAHRAKCTRRTAGVDQFTKETTHGHLQVVRHHCWPHAHMPFVAPISVHLLPCRRCSRLAAGQCPRLHEHKLCNTGRGALVLLGAPSHYFASIARCLGQSAIVHIIQ